MHRTRRIGLSIAALAVVVFAAWPALPQKAAPAERLSKEGQSCLDCHKDATAGIVKDWQDSKHTAKGVDCYA